MQSDRYSGQHSSASPTAVAAYERAVAAVAAHRPGAADELALALGCSPDFIMAHALKGFAALLLARAETLAPAREALALASAALTRHGGTEQERVFIAALREAVNGHMLNACTRLERHVARQPLDFVAIKLAHGMRFMAGDHPGMLAATTRILADWRPGTPGYGFVLGCHAFGLEEAGDLNGAERIGLEAIAHEPGDAWGLHAVTHVYEMDGRLKSGIALLNNARPMWTRCHNFSFHMAWHLALYHLAQGRFDLALDVYDADVRPVASEDFRDIANAVSLLWRLRQERVDVGMRWSELEHIARKRQGDTTLIFASLHHLLTLIAVGDMASARALVAAIGARAVAGDCEQAWVANIVGHELGEALLTTGTRTKPRGDLIRLAQDLPLMGGSHAQLDVFLRSLALIAADTGNAQAASTIMSARAKFRRDDSFAANVRTRLNVLREASAFRLAS